MNASSFDMLALLSVLMQQFESEGMDFSRISQWEFPLSLSTKFEFS